MIRLTRFNNQVFTVNSDLIKFVENAPDTVLTLITGEKILVRESADEVVRRVIDFRRSVLAGLPSVAADVNIAASARAELDEQQNQRTPGGPHRG